MYNKKFSGGFTLIELLIAIFVLATGVVTVMQAFPLGTYIQKSAQLNTIASELAQSKMEEILPLSYDDILLGVAEEPYGFSSSTPSFERKTEITYFDPNDPGVPPAGDLGIKKIVITVFWHSPIGINERNVKIANFIVQR